MHVCGQLGKEKNIQCLQRSSWLWGPAPSAGKSRKVSAENSEERDFVEGGRLGKKGQPALMYTLWHTEHYREERLILIACILSVGTCSFLGLKVLLNSSRLLILRTMRCCVRYLNWAPRLF